MKDVLFVIIGIIAFRAIKELFSNEPSKPQTLPETKTRRKRRPMPLPVYSPETEDEAAFTKELQDEIIIPEGPDKNQPTNSPATTYQSDTPSENEIASSSVEEVRKGIIWGEILQRKY